MDTRTRSHTRRSLLGGGAALAVGTAASAGWAYDRFLREKAQATDVTALEDEDAVVEVDSASAVTTATTYESGTASISLSSRTSGSGDEALAWFVASVAVTDARVVRAAFAEDTFGQNITELPSEIASAHGAVLAINGDYYGFRSTGIVLRNGVVHRDEPARDALVMYTDGRVEVVDETTTSAQELLEDGAWNVLSFGPAVVVDAAVPDGIEDIEIDTNIGNHSIQGRQPRTAVGARENGDLVLMVVDGRAEGYSRGVTLPELGALPLDEGCVTGYNLDGGGSSTMLFDGELVNRPRGGTEERATSDILYVAG
ncbi:phosphodiester glycosidase family protein [Brachybacterium sp. sponge]|uniref:phosphodiester glycosidase family protein n=1 Tax=Brachybacterium sp. sponge TaxID=1775432 RepID=UPI0007A3EE2D|nr:phosphodiester glycosidase family protein [Brachybacterium sp. sponge]